MKFKYIIAIFCVFFSPSCANNQIHNRHFIINETLSNSYAHFEKSINKKRSVLAFQGGKTASSCKTYLNMVSQFAPDETVQNQLVKSEYLICDALDILSAPSKSMQGVDISNMGAALLSKLDLRSFPSSLFQSCDDISHTLMSLYPDHVRSNNNLAELKMDDWALTLEVVAVADINDNLFKDWVIWLFDEAKAGNYRGYQTLVIYDPEIHDRFEASPYP